MGQRIKIKYKLDLLAIEDINAKELVLTQKGIESIRDIEGLDRLVNLNSLNLEGNRITRIDGLDQLVNLKTLKLNRNQISKIEGLDQLVNLEKLELSYNKITRIEGLDRLVNLEEIILYGNQIARIEGLDRLVNLNSLNLEGNRITRIEGLDRLVNLESLYLDGNQIVKFEGLDKLVNLERLGLRSNNIATIEGLDRLVHLKALSLFGNWITTTKERQRPPKKGTTIIVQPADSHVDSDYCNKMNLKAKKALKAKDFAASVNILNELTALCTANLQATRFLKEKYSDWILIQHDMTYQNWNDVLKSNLDIVQKAKKASQDLAGLSKGKLAKIMEEWKDHAVNIEMKEQKTGSRSDEEPSNASIIMGGFVIPVLLADGIFIALGFLISPLVPPSFTTMFWCALLIPGSAGLEISIFLVTFIVDIGENRVIEFAKGSFTAVILVNGFVYAGELVWFLIVSLQLAGVVGLIILAQFIGQYIIAVGVSSGVIVFDLSPKHYGKK